MPQNDYKAYADELYVKYNGLVEEYNKLLGQFNALNEKCNDIEKAFLLYPNFNKIIKDLYIKEKRQPKKYQSCFLLVCSCFFSENCIKRNTIKYCIAKINR